MKGLNKIGGRLATCNRPPCFVCGASRAGFFCMSIFIFIFSYLSPFSVLFFSLTWTYDYPRRTKNLEKKRKKKSTRNVFEMHNRTKLARNQTSSHRFLNNVTFTANSGCLLGRSKQKRQQVKLPINYLRKQF